MVIYPTGHGLFAVGATFQVRQAGATHVVLARLDQHGHAQRWAIGVARGAVSTVAEADQCFQLSMGCAWNAMLATCWALVGNPFCTCCADWMGARKEQQGTILHADGTGAAGI